MKYKLILSIILLAISFSTYGRGYFGNIGVCMFNNPSPEMQQCNETDEDYKKRIQTGKNQQIAGTEENKSLCSELTISIGLCKTRYYASCDYVKDLYRRNCVYGNENTEDKISSIPVLSPEQYYDKRDGRWLTRIEYCNYLKQHPMGGRSLKFYNNLYKTHCSDIP